MRLALGLGEFDEIGVLQPRRLRQHRTGDRNVVVLRKLCASDSVGALAIGASVRDISARALVSISTTSRHEHVVEQPDVVLVEMRRRRR